MAIAYPVNGINYNTIHVLPILSLSANSAIGHNFPAHVGAIVGSETIYVRPSALVNVWFETHDEHNTRFQIWFPTW